jgi:polysaccharide pyruvyl transferase WcaK-like protein
MNKNILIINQFSSNKGDRAVLYSILRLLDSYKNFSITVSTSNPADWKDKYSKRKIRFVPWGWDYHINSHNKVLKLKFFILRRFQRYTYPLIRLALKTRLPASLIKTFINSEFFDALVNSDLVISTGGHHITTLLAKNAISSQLFDLACCIIMNKKTILWSQTIGPLDFTNRRNEVFVRSLLMRIESAYLRDKSSSEFLLKMGVREDHFFSTCETVLSISDLNSSNKPFYERDNVTGISIYSTKNRTKEELHHYIKTISRFADHCVEKYSCSVLFIPMELKNSGPDDRGLIAQIINNTNHKAECSIADEDLSTEDHFKLVQNCRYFIGHKTHSVIFALATATPLVALAYHPKTSEFMEQYDLKRFSIPDEELSPELLINTFDKLTKEAEVLSEQIFEKSKSISQKISRDFNQMIRSSLNG